MNGETDCGERFFLPLFTYEQ